MSFTAQFDEALAQVQRRQTPVAECEAGQQVQRDGGNAPATGDPGEQRQPDYYRAQLDEYERGIVRVGAHEGKNVRLTRTTDPG
jgi:hypothetical protein